MNREGALHSSHNSIFNEQRPFPVENLSLHFEGTRMIPIRFRESKHFFNFSSDSGDKKPQCRISLPTSATELLRFNCRESTHGLETVKTFFVFVSFCFVRGRSHLRKNAVTLLTHRSPSKSFYRAASFRSPAVAGSPEAAAR
jgi:hypothetical protein